MSRDEQMLSWKDVRDVWVNRNASRERIAAIQRARLQTLVAHARQNSPFYRRCYAHLPASVDDLSCLPPLSKPELMSSFDEWVTDPAVHRSDVDAFLADKTHVGQTLFGHYMAFATSGTTGHPGIFLHDVDAVAIYSLLVALRGYVRWLGGHGLVRVLLRGNRITMIIATGGHFASTTWVTRTHALYPSLANFTCILPVSLPMREMVQALNAARPAVLFSYPTVFNVLVEEKHAGRLRISPELIITSAEPLAITLKHEIEAAFHCPVRESYGASEFLTVATACVHCDQGWMHVHDDYVILEPVDANYRPVAPGERSHTVLLTNLINHVQPIIRYDLGDAVTVKPTPCPCGSAFSAIQVEGRSDDVLYLRSKSGETVPLLPRALAGLLEQIVGLKQFQLMQTGASELTLRLEAQMGANPDAVWRSAEAGLRAFLAAHGLSSATLARSADPPMRDPKSGKFREVWRIAQV